MTEIIKRDTVAEIVREYERIRRETTAGYKLLERAETALKSRIYQFGRVTRQNHYNTFDSDTLNGVLQQIKCDTWQGIIERLNVRNMMDSARRNTLDNQLKTGEGLPEITTDAVLDVIQGMIGQLGEFTNSMIKEAFELMRRKSDGYKSTGQAWMIQDKVVLGWMVERHWNGKGYRLMYTAEDDARTIENAFRLLDGKGPLKANCAEFAGGLNSSPNGEGETEYFRFRAHKNHNLHLWLKRPDLVKLMNETAGGSAILKAG